MAEDLRGKYVILDWLPCLLAFRMPIKTKPLFIYGKPRTRKILV